jgi:Tol biopolymer transport system component
MLKKIFVIVMAMLFCFMPFAGCATAYEYDRECNISFSPDGKKLIFNRSKSDQSSMIQTYNMETGELIAYKSPIGEMWDYPQYSFDGKYIIFVTTPKQIIHKKLFFLWDIPYEDYFPNNSQIAIMDTDGKNVRKITNTIGLKSYPSFSHSGKKIIFTRSDLHRKQPKMGWNWSVNEVDLKTGQETCLTQFKFFSMSRPYYFPDDKTFIFEGSSLTLAPGMSDDRIPAIMNKINKELESKYQHNSIYVMQANEKELKPYIVMPEYRKKFKGDYEHSGWPALSADGSVLIFVAGGYKPDGSSDFNNHLYQYSTDENHRSITSIPRAETAEAVSPDGKQIAFIPANSNKISIYQVKDGTSREITLPAQPSRIINGQ